MAPEKFFVTQFSELGLAEPILRAITAEGYDTPTPIQEQLIPQALAGRDIVGIAQTGTGKTAAFTLPTLHRLHTTQSPMRPKSPRALILAPTRELVLQISASVRTYGRYAHMALTEIVGGVKPNPQVRAMAPGVDVLVATPGRLLDHMNSGAVRLNETKIVILDEADQMMDMGFIPAIRRVMAATAKNRQTMLLSATMPKAIRALAQDFLTDPIEVAVASQARPIELIDQHVVHSHRDGKKDLLIAAMSEENVERAIVFTRTKRGADRVARLLGEAGISAEAIHGNKSQGQRNRALDNFKKGKCKALVATDVASRGIDIDEVSHVINYELPNIAESYVHRIGRTARAGRSGMAISFCEGEERAWLRDIEKLIGMTIPFTGEMQREVAPPVPGRGGRQQNRQGQSREPRRDRPRKGAFSSGEDKPWTERPDRPRRPKTGRPDHASATPKGEHPLPRDGAARKPRANDDHPNRARTKSAPSIRARRDDLAPDGRAPVRFDDSAEKVRGRSGAARKPSQTKATPRSAAPKTGTRGEARSGNNRPHNGGKPPQGPKRGGSRGSKRPRSAG